MKTPDDPAVQASVADKRLIPPQAAGRHADEDWQNFDVSMTDDSVWEILKTADKYNVEQLTDLCFTFLLQKHSRRKRSRHLCVVLEMAHHLNYTHHHEQLLHKVKRKAARVLKNQDALAELCQQCMLAIVKADDLVGVDEVLVHDAVLKWTQIECARQGRQPDSWEELRDVAGDLVQHVRYLTFPKHTLTGLRAGDPSSCLLTQSELGSLRKGHISRFPFTVQCKRGVKFEDQKKTIVCGQQVNSNCLSPLIFLAALFLLLLFAIVYIPVYLAVHGDPEMKAPTLTNVDGSHN
nr:hypothetical protein BaRGS_026886 [Batillaria attramentaria]